MDLSAPYQVLKVLAAGSVRTVDQLAEVLRSDRKAVLASIETLCGLGMSIVAGEDDRIAADEPVELLNIETILSGLSAGNRQQVAGLTVKPSLESTNSSLLCLPAGERHAQVLLAEHQSSGRGRRGRSWLSPFARNIYLSLGWCFEQPLSGLGCLPLVVALAVAEALGRAGLDGHQVKWPNDLMMDGRKLAGCLVEMQTDAHGSSHAVIGVGININMPGANLTSSIDQPWTDLQSQLPSVSRNKVAALVLDELINYLESFASLGFEPLMKRWQLLDYLEGKSVSVDFQGRQVNGKAAGVDHQGALLLQTDKETLSLHSGEVSLSKTPV